MFSHLLPRVLAVTIWQLTCCFTKPQRFIHRQSASAENEFLQCLRVLPKQWGLQCCTRTGGHLHHMQLFSWPWAETEPSAHWWGPCCPTPAPSLCHPSQPSWAALPTSRAEQCWSPCPRSSSTLVCRAGGAVGRNHRTCSFEHSSPYQLCSVPIKGKPPDPSSERLIPIKTNSLCSCQLP